jgi:hypothetical protein
VAECIKREDAVEAVWRILNGMGISQKHNERLAEEVDAVLDDYQTEDVVIGRDFRDCRNELCLKCGNYQQKHLGACDGCRWKESANG